MRFGLLLFVLLSETALADVDVRVGFGGNCATTSIQTAINGAVAENGITNILIARNVDYTSQQLTIASKNVRLIGGYADCKSAAPDGVKTVLNGAGGGANTVITVSGTSSVVAFYNLEVTGGDEVTSSSGKGGGFTIAGGPHGLVFFDNVYVHDNQAGYGGGIFIRNDHSSDADDVYAYFGDNVRFDSNYGAYGGGGMWCSNAKVVFVGSNSYIARNSTAGKVGATIVNGPGGGIRAENCAMWIGATSTLGTLSQNVAGGSGGGLSVTGERALVYIYTRVANRPPAILLNTAGGTGGGIDVGSSARVTGFGLVVSDNTSRDGGGAISVYDNDDPPSALVKLQGTLEDAPDDASSPEGLAVQCAAGLACNRVSFNQAVSVGGSWQTGAAIRVFADSGLNNRANPEVMLYGTLVSGNQGASLIRIITDAVGLAQGEVTMNGALLTGNTVTGTLIQNVSDNFNGLDGYLGIYASTIAGNDIGAADVIGASGFIGIKSSIIWQPGKRTVHSLGGDVLPGDVDYTLASDLTGVPASTHNGVADPRFQSAATGDYHLRLDSPAVDFAPTLVDGAGNPTVTADNLPRNIDLTSVVNEFGSVDLGAYERQFACAADTVFCNGFE